MFVIVLFDFLFSFLNALWYQLGSFYVVILFMFTINNDRRNIKKKELEIIKEILTEFAQTFPRVTQS